jgi:hypothetical protein
MTETLRRFARNIDVATLKCLESFTDWSFGEGFNAVKRGLVVLTSKNRTERSKQDAKLITGRETNRVDANQAYTLR